MNTITEINGWLVNSSDDGQYLYIERNGAPGQIHIKADDEGFVVDIFTADDPDSVASTCAAYSELEPE